MAEIAKIKKALKKKFEDARANEIREQNDKEKDKKSLQELGVVLSPETNKNELSLKEAKKIQNMKKQLQSKFKQEFVREINKEEDQEKMFKPITKALQKVQSAVSKVDKDLPLLALQPPPTPKSPASIEMGTQTPRFTNLGNLAKEYLSRANDPVFGIWYDKASKVHKIGKEEIQFDGNDIYLNNQKYAGTQGLWRLLTYQQAPEENRYTHQDFKNYEEMLRITDSMFQNNNKDSGKAKSSRGNKWISLVSKIWKNTKESEAQTGSGLVEYNEKPIEYKYIQNLSELLNRLYFIAAEEQAGNNNFFNEKRGILHFFTNEMEKLLDSKNGIELLISFISRLPKKVIGSGLINELINKLPFEMHWPGYNYLGPGTKLNKRLERGDNPINKLDEAAKKHDIYYRDHKRAEDRHTADELLENEAWNRVLAKDSDLGEKTAAWVTTNTMKIKRQLGMGLKF